MDDVVSSWQKKPDKCIIYEQIENKVILYQQIENKTLCVKTMLRLYVWASGIIMVNYVGAIEGKKQHQTT